MKKYILMLAVAAAATLVACGNKQTTDEATEAVDTIVEAEVIEAAAVVDSLATDSTAVADSTAAAPAAEAAL